MRLTRLLPLCFLPLLAACVNDRVAFDVPDTSETITLIREQPRFWEDKVELSLVIARMPDCMRRHPPVNGLANTVVELYQFAPTTYVVKIGEQMWATETRTCEGFAPMKEAPAEGMGNKLGRWQQRGETLEFVAEKAPG